MFNMTIGEIIALYMTEGFYLDIHDGQIVSTGWDDEEDQDADRRSI